MVPDWIGGDDGTRTHNLLSTMQRGWSLSIQPSKYSPLAQAGVIPGRGDKVSVFEADVPVAVRLKSGDRVEGRFLGLTESALDLATRSAQGKIPRSEIHTIATLPKDGVGDGAAKGTAAGAIATGILRAIAYA